MPKLNFQKLTLNFEKLSLMFERVFNNPISDGSVFERPIIQRHRRL
jgi:hypothetical protein